MRTAWNKGLPAPWAKNNPQIFKKGHKTWNTGMKGYGSGSANNMWKGGLKREISCQKCGVKFTDFPSNGKKFCSKTCAMKTRIPWNKGKPYLQLRGEKHPNWKGGKGRHDPERKRIDAKLWSRNILERDKFACLWCGELGGNKEVHHIKKWVNNPELRYELSNGITLCRKCHCKTFNQEQLFEEFFKELLKKAVNSVEVSQEIIPSQPRMDIGILEGVTTRD